MPNAADILGPLTTERPRDYGIDHAFLQRKYGRSEPVRRHYGRLRIPLDASPRIVRAMTVDAGKQFLAAKAKMGWKLISPLRAEGPFRTKDPISGEPMNGFRLYGDFETKPKPRRIPLPAGIIKREPDEEISLRAAAKALGIRPKKERKINEVSTWQEPIP